MTATEPQNQQAQLIRERDQLLQLQQLVASSVPKESIEFMNSQLVQRAIQLGRISGYLDCLNAEPASPMPTAAMAPTEAPVPNGVTASVSTETP